MTKIIIATKNRGKAREYQQLFAKKGIQIKTLNDFGSIPQARETGHSFAENALIKASAAVKHFHLPALADDSGLEVHSINDEPGIYSARYAGDHDDLANQRKLLRRLSGHHDRRATFVTCLILLKPNQKRLITVGKLNGIILRHPRGQNGFGYDPLFYVPSRHRTLAEMTTAEKDSISHRGIAARKMMDRFDDWWRNH